MISTTEFKKGLKLEIEGKPYEIVFIQFVNPGKGSAFYKTKLRNLETGLVIERTFKSGVDTGAVQADLHDIEMEYMYGDHSGFHFMDQATYESICLTDEQVTDTKGFFQEGMRLKVLYYKGKPISVDLPNFVVLRVKETDPGLKGDTASGGSKKAVMETGLQINVPLFVKEGELLKIDTRTCEYVERVKG
ncbi:MAG: elongation factor P [Bdellovibrionales bacterium RIFOXYA1_FULL_36_14]|nr:MAG: elongation factor P [Bdellovibrionales bacterium RIFOXYA1_FULL_36_14]